MKSGQASCRAWALQRPRSGVKQPSATSATRCSLQDGVRPWQAALSSVSGDFASRGSPDPWKARPGGERPRRHAGRKAPSFRSPSSRVLCDSIPGAPPWARYLGLRGARAGAQGVRACAPRPSPLPGGAAWAMVWGRPNGRPPDTACLGDRGVSRVPWWGTFGKSRDLENHERDHCNLSASRYSRRHLAAPY